MTEVLNDGDDVLSVGAWIRRRRLALDLTQAQLAQLVACASITIRKLESDERRPSPLMADRLADALQLDGGARRRFLDATRAVGSSLPVGLVLTSDARPARASETSRLPAPPNDLIGREDELADLLDRLAPSGGPARLLTISGAPGVGKTRLAVELARRSERKLDLAAVFVDLSAAAEPGDVAMRVAASLDTPVSAPTEVLSLVIAALRRAPTLLVLDNFEHVLEAAEIVPRIVEACPELVCVVTSRSPLGVYGEHQYQLGPLRLDDAEISASTALFLARADEVRPGYDWSRSLPTVSEICRLLDGLPLAIELAARRLRDLDAHELLASLHGHDVTLGTVPRARSERQRSAEGAVAWSYRLLSADAARMLDAVSVFPSSFDAEAAASVSGRPERAREALAELVDQALVQRVDGFQAYRCLMVVREFGRARLAAANALDDTRARHADLTVVRAEAVSPGIEAWPDRESVAALDRLDADVRHALAWAFGPGGDPEIGRRLYGAIMPAWYVHAAVMDSLRWSTLCYEATPRSEHHYKCAYYLALARWMVGDLAAARSLLEEAADLSAACGLAEPSWIADTIGMRQTVAISAGDLAGAETMHARVVATAEQAGDEWRALAAYRAGRMALLRGDTASASDFVERAATIWAGIGSAWGVATAASMRGDVALAQGRYDDAITTQLDAAEQFLAIDDVIDAIGRLACVAAAAMAANRPEAAATVLGLVDAWSAELGSPVHPALAAVHRRAWADVHTVLGDAVDEARERGARLPRTIAAVQRVVAVASPTSPISIQNESPPRDERGVDRPSASHQPGAG